MFVRPHLHRGGRRRREVFLPVRRDCFPRGDPAKDERKSPEIKLNAGRKAPEIKLDAERKLCQQNTKKKRRKRRRQEEKKEKKRRKRSREEERVARRTRRPGRWRSSPAACRPHAHAPGGPSAADGAGQTRQTDGINMHTHALAQLIVLSASSRARSSC